MRLRDYQIEAYNKTLTCFENKQTALIVLATGLGKCFAKGTPIMLWSGQIAPVEKIKPSDCLMGPDGDCRIVTSTCSGMEMMYRVSPVKGEPYIVNESHILSLKITKLSRSHTCVTDANGVKYRSGDIANIDIKTYLSSNRTFKHCAKGYRVGVRFQWSHGTRILPLDPYIFGVWLGDGHSRTPSVTTMDQEIVDALEQYVAGKTLKVLPREQSGKSTTHHIVASVRGQPNEMMNALKQLRVIQNKHIPHEYKTVCGHDRAELLAGLLDTDGSYTGGCYDFTSKYRCLAEDVAFLARSLGLAAYVRPCEKTCANNGKRGTYYRVCISGDIWRIPCRIPRKKAKNRRQKKDVLVTGISVEPVGFGNYYGFTLAGNDRRFLLGDFTVAHNTVVAAHIAEAFKDQGRILLLAHREELIFQGQRTLETIMGCGAEIEMADSWAAQQSFFGANRIVCSTIQTQIAGRDGGRMTRFNPADFSLVILDEAHHGTAASYRKVIDYYRQNADLKLLGLTATPDRADEEALGQIFEDVAFEYDIMDGIDGGWLVPIQQQAVFVEGLDFSQIRTTAGDLNGADLAEVLEFEENLHGMATPILELCGEKRTLIFTATVAQAERMAEILNRHKAGSAEFVSGETPKEYRRSLFERYKVGQFQYLCNVGVLTEGYDEPGIECVAMARPTKSRSLYSQMIGRGTRALPGLVDLFDTPELRRGAIEASGKPILSVVDFVGNAGRHKLMHCADVLGGKYSDEIVELANRTIEKSGKPANIATELVKAEREIDRRRRMRQEAETRAAIRLRASYKTATVNPFDVLDITPNRIPGWHRGRMATDGQRNCLLKFGVNPPPDLSFAHAGQLIEKLIGRSRDHKATFKQVKLLKSRGIDATDLTMKEATAKIDEIAKREGWQQRARTG